MTASLELAKDAFGRHLALEVLDRALESTFTDVNFDWLTLYGLDHERFCSLQERRRLTQCTRQRKEDWFLGPSASKGLGITLLFGVDAHFAAALGASALEHELSIAGFDTDRIPGGESPGEDVFR